MSSTPLDYTDTVLTHFRAPRNAGSFPDGTANVAQGRAGDRRRGRDIHLEVKLTGEGRVEAMRYRVYGCPATIALCSVLSERVVGHTKDEAAAMGGLGLAEELGLPATKRDAALLLEGALRAALG